MGYRTAALSSSASKAELVKQLGADLYLDGSEVKLGGAAVIVCTAPSGEAMAELPEGLAVNGEPLVLAAVPGLTGAPLSEWMSGTAIVYSLSDADGSLSCTSARRYGGGDTPRAVRSAASSPRRTASR